VTITSVSRDPKIDNYNRVGSVNGGTILYIKCSGLDGTAVNNVVMVGPYPCTVASKSIYFQYLTNKIDNLKTFSQWCQW
jgi:hypothetical protein